MREQISEELYSGTTTGLAVKSSLASANTKLLKDPEATAVVKGRI